MYLFLQLGARISVNGGLGYDRVKCQAEMHTLIPQTRPFDRRTEHTLIPFRFWGGFGVGVSEEEIGQNGIPPYPKSLRASGAIGMCTGLLGEETSGLWHRIAAEGKRKSTMFRGQK